jgi:hypothetical protein
MQTLPITTHFLFFFFFRDNYSTAPHFSLESTCQPIN